MSEVLDLQGMEHSEASRSCEGDDYNESFNSAVSLLLC